MELLKDLRHPHIVHCFGGTCEGDQWFYAMELVEGGTLADLIEEQGRLPWRQTIDFGLQTCLALQHAHERQIIHRDLKPGNLLVTKSGKLKLSDFGLAQMTADTKLTQAGKTVGSLHYMAPEQIQGKPPLSNRTDLYALGCVLYEMLTGRPPFLGGAMAEVLQRHIRETPAPVSSIAFDVPPQLEALVAELLSKDPAQRPADAQAVAKRLREIDQSVTIKMPRFDRNKTIDPVRTETVSADIPQSGRKVDFRILVAVGLVAMAVGWSAAWFGRPKQVSHETISLVLSGMQDPNPQVRMFAARTLGGLGPDAGQAIEGLLKSVEDPDALVRVEILKAIGKIGPGDGAVLAPLTKVQQKDEIPMVRDAAAEAMKDIRKQTQRSSAPFFVTLIVGILLLAGGGYWGWKKFT
jgi:serine/threonine-protein kinase